MNRPGPAGTGGARAVLSPAPSLHSKAPRSLVATKPSKSHCSQTRSFAGLGGISSPWSLGGRTCVPALPSGRLPARCLSWRGTSPGAACSGVRREPGRVSWPGCAKLRASAAREAHAQWSPSLPRGGAPSLLPAPLSMLCSPFPRDAAFAEFQVSALLSYT